MGHLSLHRQVAVDHQREPSQPKPIIRCMRQFVFNSRAASNMARLLSVAAIVLLLLGSDSLTAECRHLRLAGERGTGVALRRLLVGGLRSPPNCSLWGLGNCTTGGAGTHPTSQLHRP